MNPIVTVRLEEEMQQRLEAISERTGMSRSDIIRDALKRQLALMAFEEHRKALMPYAEAKGYLTDEDIFKEVS